MAAEEKLAYIQAGDEVGHYGAIKQLDGSRDTFYSTVIGTQSAADGTTRLLIASRKFLISPSQLTSRWCLNVSGSSPARAYQHTPLKDQEVSN